ncbi:diacylglycerol O-acyltransferase/trehalose O-mycolyltransferase [Rhodococcus sp. PvR044]|uniref:alpha/beta hydrolase n=1 Tax=Rhodococcus sp. PvR044 TaxID=3156402 RepID=UPI00339A8D94
MVHTSGRRAVGRRALIGFLAAAAVIAVAGPVAAAAPSTIAHRAPAGGYEEVSIPSAMGPVKVQIQWAARGGDAALYLLDGLRARDDVNGWALETDAARQFAGDNVTLVMPVGGQSSFYTDWIAPSNFNGQRTTYKWESFLTNELPDYLATRGVSRTNNAVVGLSMGGSAALSLAAHHRDQFKAAGSLSGYLNLSAPGMREAIRVAMLSGGGFNADAMWGPPWGKGWLRNDPFVFAPQLKGMPLYISAASGLPGQHDDPRIAGFINTTSAISLEALSLAQTRAFEIRLTTLGVPAQFSFPAAGTHSWGYWQDELAKARPMILDALNAH